MEKIKYILNPYLKVVLCSEDEIVVRHGMRSSFSEIIKDENKKRLIGKIVKYFKESVSIEDLISKNVIKEHQIDEMESTIGYLYQKGVLIKPSEDINEVYLRNILKGNTNLSQFRIGIIGAGYLGQRIIKQFLRLGIKNLVFYDDRSIKNYDVESKFFDFDTIPLSKNKSLYVDLVKDSFSSLGFNNIEGIIGSLDDSEGLTKVFQKVDLIIAPFEFFSSKTFHIINKVAIQTQKPWMSVYIDGSQGVIGPIYIPGESLCYSEFEMQMEASLRLKDEYIIYKDFLDEEGLNFFHSVIPPYLEIISNLAVIFAIKFLIKKESPSIGRSIFINFEDMSIDYQDIMKLPRCPACENLKPIYKHSFV